MAKIPAPVGLVFIVDDEKPIRHQWDVVLRSAGYTTRLFSSGEEFLESHLPSEPACLVLDVILGGRDGPSVYKQLLQRGYILPTIFVSAHATVPMAVDALKSGAVDVLTKPVPPKALLAAVKKALSIGHEELVRQHERGKVLKLIQELTERELEVMTWLITGMLNKQVAYALGITERTVKAHRASIMQKLGVVSVAELVRLADKAGIEGARE